MTGSAKQIEWAENIKANAYMAIENIRNSNYGTMLDGEKIYVGYSIDCKQYSDSAVEEALAFVKNSLDKTFSSIDSAAKIIDNRYKFDSQNIHNVVSAYLRKFYNN